MFTWDPQKAILNYGKYGVSFEEAATIFSDPRALEWEDPEHSGMETRLKSVGISPAHRILMVVYTIRRSKSGNEEIRIISARQASQKERKAYAGSRY
jgi:uncharacterized DUF497 family protein